jgi:hypothetical protein
MSIKSHYCRGIIRGTYDGNRPEGDRDVPEAELPKLMTGVDGRERDFSVPPGQVRAEWLKKQDAIAERVFCPQFLGLWRATETPFHSLFST